MATLEELENEWSKDCKIDRTNLDGESLKIPELHNKYYKLYIRERVQFKQDEFTLDEFLKTKTQYYQGKLDKQTLDENKWEPFDLILIKQDLDLYLDADKDIIKRKLKMHLQKEKVEFLESIIKTINNRSFIIRDALEFIKFSSGK